jgi:MFS superfamily sulfate permease-like transporter
MGIDREWGVMRGAEDRERVETFRGILMLRIGMSLYYANALHVMREIEQLVQIRIDSEDKPNYVVVDFSGVNFIDITGIEVFCEHVRHLREKNVKFAAIYMRTSVLNALREAPDLPEITILHNITEMKQCCLGRDKTLVLGGSLPEYIGKAH